MKNVIIAGATGMTGGLVLDYCLASPEIKSVTVIVRKPTGITNYKLNEVVHPDFSDLSAVTESFKNQDIAYYCLGVYTGAVDRETFRKITLNYTQVFADTLRKISPETTFYFLSGMGADPTEKSKVMFARDKGAAENYLNTLNFNQLFIFRPAYIYPVIPRKEPNLTYRIFRFFYPVMKLMYPSGVIPSTNLAKAMFHAGLKGTEKHILENIDIRQLAAKI